MLAADYPAGVIFCWPRWMPPSPTWIRAAVPPGSLQLGLPQGRAHPAPDIPRLPFLAPLLDMPVLELPGDHDMPRVQDGAFGPPSVSVSLRATRTRATSTCGGQSGHPLSPYYRAGFLEWAHGQPLPFLPGNAEHTLTLQPD